MADTLNITLASDIPQLQVELSYVSAPPVVVQLAAPDQPTLVVELGHIGPKGDKGDAGENAVPDAHYEHDQPVASATWTVTHSLGKYPSVSVVDSAGDVVVGEINYVNNNSLTINFSSAFSGKAYLN